MPQNKHQHRFLLALAATTTTATTTLFLPNFYTSCSNEEPRLLQVHIIFRHGARTPVFWSPKLKQDINTDAFQGKCSEVNLPPGVAGSHSYPGPFKAAHLDVRDLDGKSRRPRSDVDSFQLAPIYSECRAGQLTTLGAQQSAELGKTLKGRYGEIIDEAKKDKNLWIRTSNVARCVATLEFVLGELFHRTEKGDKGDKESKGDEKVYLTHTAPNHLEWLYPNTSACSLMAQLMNAAKQDWSKDPDPDAKKAYELLKKKLPENVFKTLKIEGYNFVRIRDYLVSYETHGLPRPWIDDDDELVKMVELVGSRQIARFLHHGNESFSTMSARAGIGNLLSIIFSSILLEKETPRVSIVSAHDTTLMPILSACGAWDGESWPGFCSWVAFEFWNDGKVKLIFNGNVAREFTESEFREMAIQLTPQNGKTWQDICNESHPVLPQIEPHEKGGDHW